MSKSKIRRVIIIASIVFILIPVLIFILENRSFHLKSTAVHSIYSIGGQAIQKAVNAELQAVKKWGWNSGKKHGRYIEYYGNSLDKRIEGYYKNDRRIGIWKHWDINGKLLSAKPVENDDKKLIQDTTILVEATGNYLILFNACSAGDAIKVENLLKSGVEANFSHKGLYPLHAITVSIQTNQEV